MKKKKQAINNGVEWTKNQINFVLAKHQAGYSRLEISKMYRLKYLAEGSERSPDSIKHCIEVYGQHIEKDIPRVLFLDVETKPMKAFVWGAWENNVSLDMLIEDGSILSFSAKWAGDPDNKVIYHDMRGKEKNLNNDKELMKKMWKLLDEADYVLGHNLIRFDIPKINERFIHHGLGAPSDYKMVDTMRMAKSKFAFFSNKLAHLSHKLAKKHKKTSHNEFPGFSLWSECLKGNKKAWNSMKSYNIIDTLALEEVFLELAKYMKNNKNVTAILRAYKNG